jgi:diacylglycerol kinase
MYKSFKDAFHGIRDAFRSELNLRIHFLATILAVVLAFYLKFNLTEFAILTLTIFSVVIFELINTVVEKLVDMHSLEISEEARIIKDISAGAVLLSAIMAAIIGLLLFLPKLF